MNAPLSSPSGRVPPTQWHLLLLSAKSEPALSGLLEDAARYCASPGAAKLADVSFTLLRGRERFPLRRALVCRDAQDAAAVLAGQYPERMLAAKTAVKDRGVIFSFGGAGQGDEALGGARALYRSDPDFREAVDRCMVLMDDHTSGDWPGVFLSDDPGRDRMTLVLDRPDIGGSVLFIFEYALASSWIKRGLRPQALTGREGGEALAAHLAGGLSLGDALAWAKAPGAAPLSLGSTSIPVHAADSIPDDGAPLILEVGSGRIIEGGGDRGGLPPKGGDVWLGVFDGVHWMMNTLAELAIRGVAVDWSAYFAHRPGRRVSFPTYRFDRRSHWFPVEREAEPQPLGSLSERRGLGEGEDIRQPSPPPARSMQPPQVVLPQPVEEPKVSASRQGEIAAFLRDTCQTMLGIEQIELDDNVIQMGMDSLNVMQLSKLVTETFGVRIAPHHLFSRPDIGSLAEKIAGLCPEASPPMRRPAAEDDPSPQEDPPLDNAATSRLVDFVSGLSDGQIDLILKKLGGPEANRNVRG
ncbi:phosphopantetheine-binding protein [Rhodospirillum sp. A1_3_36]|uniref:CurL C-terminal domain-containing protein n=1 Tax=Rhodospirillum sp. A1_3_36 TaxID=3391666 RepID=UPI0039A6896E